MPIQTGEIPENTRTKIKILGKNIKKIIYTDHNTSSSKVSNLKQDSKTSKCSQENLRNPFLQLSQLSIIFINIIILTIIFFLLKDKIRRYLRKNTFELLILTTYCVAKDILHFE